MSIVAHSWVRFFDTLGVGWLATLQVVDLPNVVKTAFEAALLIVIPTVLGGFLVVWLYGRWPAIRHAWPLVLILGTILGGGAASIRFYQPRTVYLPCRNCGANRPLSAVALAALR